MTPRNPAVPSTHSTENRAGLDPDETQNAHEDKEEQEQAAPDSPREQDTTRLPKPGGRQGDVA